jgi:hypothetical protein
MDFARSALECDASSHPFRVRFVPPHSLPFPCHPMQGQSWHQKEEYEHDTQLDEEQQHQSAEFFFVDFEEVRRPGCAGAPKQERRAEIEQSEYEADDKCAEEKVPEENDPFAFHAAINANLAI